MNRRSSILACCGLLALSLQSCGSDDQVEAFVRFVEGIPDDTDMVSAIADEFHIRPSFRLSVKGGSSGLLPSQVQAATTNVKEVQITYRRDGDLAEEVVIPTAGGDPIPLDLVALANGADDGDGVELGAGVLPDCDVVEVRLILSEGTVRLEGRDIPLRFEGGSLTGVRITLTPPWTIRQDSENRVRVHFDVAPSFVPDENHGFILRPVLRAAGNSHGVPEMEPLIGTPVVFPVAVRENTPTSVTAYVRVVDSSVDRSSLHLTRVFRDGTSVSLGTVNDSGSGGDDETDDTFYTTVTEVSEPAGEAFFRIEGLTTDGRPIRSTTSRVEIAPPGVPIELFEVEDPEQEIQAVEDDLTGALMSPRLLLAHIRPGTPFSDVQAFAAGGGATAVGRLPELDTWQMMIPGDGTTDGAWVAAVDIALADPRVERVEPVTYASISGVTTTDPPVGPAIANAMPVGSPISTTQRHLFAHSVLSTWPFSRGGVKVGVVDTGVDRGHADLNPRLQVGLDWTRYGRTRANDNDGHGTSVAGIIGALTDNSLDVAGITWFGRVFFNKIMDHHGTPTTVDSSGPAGIVEAAQQGAWVINNSWGSRAGSAGPGVPSSHRRRSAAARIARRVAAARTAPARFSPAAIRRAARTFINQASWVFRHPTNWTDWKAMNYAHIHNCLTVAAAGNDLSTLRTSPGFFADLEVAASAPTPLPVVGVPPPVNLPLGLFFSASDPGSNYGSSVDVSALGGRDPSSFASVLGTTQLGGGITLFAGTSGASPIVSGIAALFWAQNKTQARTVVDSAIRDGARDGGSAIIFTTPLPFRNVDAFETFNPNWRTTGFWRNQVSPQNITVGTSEQTYVDRTRWLPAATPPSLPDPRANGNPGRSAWWFGSPLHGTYLSFFLSPGQPPLSGGVSPGLVPGTLRTPPITFLNSTVGPQNPVLQFKTWWEIESKAADGFDLMEVVAVNQNTGATTTLLTLNPTTLQLGATRAPQFNHASSATAAGGAFDSNPAWRTEQVLLRTSSSPTLFTGGGPFVIEFRFDTVDGLYNAFMGWMVDEVRILDGNALATLSAIPFPQGAPRPRGTVH